MSHLFILQSGIWLGDGRITLNNSTDSIAFYTKWNVQDKSAGLIQSFQEVEMVGVDEKVENTLVFSDVTDESFVIQLENEDIGVATGKGVIDPSSIAWEFRDPGGFEGYEVFKKTGEEEYEFHAEYASHEQVRTIIDGRLWKKSL